MGTIDARIDGLHHSRDLKTLAFVKLIGIDRVAVSHD